MIPINETFSYYPSKFYKEIIVFKITINSLPSNKMTIFFFILALIEGGLKMHLNLIMQKFIQKKDLV